MEAAGPFLLITNRYTFYQNLSKIDFRNKSLPLTIQIGTLPYFVAHARMKEDWIKNSLTVEEEEMRNQGCIFFLLEQSR
jgi:hypothetical protein